MNYLPRLLFSLPFLLLAHLTTICQPAAFVVREVNFSTPISLDTFFQWAADSSAKLPSQAAQALPFQPFDGEFFLDKNYGYWFRLPLQNASPGSLDALLCFDPFPFADLFFEKSPGVWERRKAGHWTNRRERSFPPSKLCHLVRLAAGQRQTLFLRLENHASRENAQPRFRLLTPVQEKMQRLENEAETSGKWHFQAAFFGILLLLIFLALLQFRVHRDRAFLFYVGYAAIIFLFFFRSVDADHPLAFFRNLQAWHPHLEAPMGYLSYVLYIAFFCSFLEMQARLPRLFRFFQWTNGAFLALLALDLALVQPLFGWRGSLEVHAWVKLPFFVLVFGLGFPAVFGMRSRLANFILAGTAFLMLPAIFTVFADILPGTYKVLTHGTLRSFTTSGFTFYTYDMRVGLLLEMCCFLLGLSYKTRQEKLRLQALGVEIERLKNDRREGLTPRASRSRI